MATTDTIAASWLKKEWTSLTSASLHSRWPGSRFYDSGAVNCPSFHLSDLCLFIFFTSLSSLLESLDLCCHHDWPRAGRGKKLVHEACDLNLRKTVLASNSPKKTTTGNNAEPTNPNLHSRHKCHMPESVVKLVTSLLASKLAAPYLENTQTSQTYHVTALLYHCQDMPRPVPIFGCCNSALFNAPILNLWGSTPIYVDLKSEAKGWKKKTLFVKHLLLSIPSLENGPREAHASWRTPLETMYF